MSNFFKKLFGGAAVSPKHDVQSEGMDAEHLQLRRAIERCDNLKHAVDAGQMTVEDVVEKLRSNNFSQAVISQAVEECFGVDAAKQ